MTFSTNNIAIYKLLAFPFFLLFKSSCLQYTSATTIINSAGLLKLEAQDCIRYAPCPLIDQATHYDIQTYVIQTEDHTGVLGQLMGMVHNKRILEL